MWFTLLKLCVMFPQLQARIKSQTYVWFLRRLKRCQMWQEILSSMLNTWVDRERQETSCGLDIEITEFFRSVRPLWSVLHAHRSWLMRKPSLPKNAIIPGLEWRIMEISTVIIVHPAIGLFLWYQYWDRDWAVSWTWNWAVSWILVLSWYQY